MSDPIHISSEALSVTVAAMGAELQSLRLNDAELLWQGDPAWWNGRAPLLFPIVGLARDDKLAFAGDVFHMPKHGFARRTLFDLAAADDTSCRHVLRDSTATRACFPFAFELAAIHRVEGATLTEAVEITNRDLRPMPFGFGFHPAFNLPPAGASGSAAVTLSNGGAPALARLRDGLLGSDRLPSPFAMGHLDITPDLFEDDALIFPDGAGDALTLTFETGPRLHFTFENLPNLAIWQKVGAPFLCIEPWHGTAGAHGGSAQMADRPWTVILDPGDTARFAWSVTAQG
ncbi:aldose 1-epimerase family protein [Salipiger aestuarii]|uniref:aldose 1-epimerase family protein n=1 Tax=Salipiger aestuarii TaxID=568098 RepID=UPI0012386EEC|nr:aldose 1-epimerase family protein [Salipiger aestuarii]KAA8615154.1 aldose epimerase [Salipiger aestuarii]